jgi:hypothetical protein
MCIFLKCLLVFIFLVRKFIFEIWGYILIIQFIYKKFLVDEYSTILILGPFLGFEVLFSAFWPPKVYSMENFRSMDISHEYTDFGTQIPFWGSGGLFSPFRPLKLYIFYKFSWSIQNFRSIDGSHDLYHFWPLISQPAADSKIFWAN